MHTRRQVIAGSGALAASIGLSRVTSAQDSTPEIGTPSASPQAGPWSVTDVFGQTITLEQRPIRIAANLMTAAALWDFGIRPIAVFDWTASAHPDGDHIGWGNVDPAAVVNVGDADGNILPEDLKVLDPDVILTLSYDSSDPGSTAGVILDLADAIGKIAPVVVVTDQGSTEQQLERLIAVARSLGADLASDEIVTARDAWEAKREEFVTVAAEKSDLTVLFANFDTTALWVAGPKGVADLQFVSSLGLAFANGGSASEAEYWEELSLEAVDTYPADILYNDVYSAFQTVEELQGQPAFAIMPAVAAGQIGGWLRDFPVNYAGMVMFLDSILAPLKTATKLT